MKEAIRGLCEIATGSGKGYALDVAFICLAALAWCALFAYIGRRKPNG